MNLSDDDDNDGEEWKGAKSKKRKKLKVNPNGPYNVEFMFQGVNWDITIENVTYDDFKVTARSDKKVTQNDVEVLKRYLQTEGFEDAAKKHNLYW